MPKLHGRIWYADGSVVDFCSREEWESAPVDGVVRIAQPGLGHLPGSGDFYWMDDDGYVNHSNSERAFLAMGGARHRKFGVTVSYMAYKWLDGDVVAWTSANREDCGCG